MFELSRVLATLLVLIYMDTSVCLITRLTRPLDWAVRLE